MSDSGMLCPHCGETEMFFKMEGKDFCGSCAKQVTAEEVDPFEDEAPPKAKVESKYDDTKKKKSPIPARMRNISDDYVSDIPHDGQLLNSSSDDEDNNNTDELEYDNDGEDDDDDDDNNNNNSDDNKLSNVKNKIEEIKAQRSKGDATPNKIKSSPNKSRHTPMRSPNKSRHTPKRSPNSAKSPSNVDIEVALASKDGDTYEFTSAQLNKLKAQIREETEMAVIQRTNAEMQIVMEDHQRDVESYEKRLQDLRIRFDEEKINLEETLEEALGKLEDAVAQHSSLKTRYVADMDEKNVEVHRLKQNLTATEEEKRQLQKELDSTKSSASEVHGDALKQQQIIEELRAELERKEQFITQLRTHAENKLKKAQETFLAMQQEAIEKSETVEELNASVLEAQEKLVLYENELPDIRNALDIAEDRANQLESELLQANRDREKVLRQFDEAEQIRTKLNAENDTLREQLLQASTEFEQMKANYEDLKENGMNSPLNQQVDKLNQENQDLKSRIFDYMEEVRNLKSELDAMGNGPGNDDNSNVQIRQKDIEIRRLHTQLQQKTKQYNEAVSMCEELIDQLEAAKAQ